MIFNQNVSGGSGGGETTIYGINAKGWCGDLQTVGGQIIMRTDQAVGTLTGLDTITNLGYWNEKFKGSTGLVGAVDLSSVKFGTFRSTFEGTRITSLDLRQLRDASQFSRVCYDNPALTSVNLSDIVHVSSAEWGGASSWELAFGKCTGLREIKLPSIRADSFEIDYEQGGYNYNYMHYAIYQCSNLVVHFSSSFGEDLETLDGYDRRNEFFEMMCGYDASTISSCSIVFDLPANDPFYATVQNAQRRFERYPSHDTASSLAWRESTLVVYTNGTSDPIVGDTLYSDSACTIVAGTISEFIPIERYTPDGGDEEEYYEEEPEE